MSVYSGFATRLEEQQYGQLTEYLVSLMSSKALSNLRGEPFDEGHFSASIVKVYKKMSQLESHKHLPPRVSNSIYELARYCASNNMSYSYDYRPVNTAYLRRASPFPNIDKHLERISERPKPIHMKTKKKPLKKIIPRDSNLYYEKLINNNFRTPRKYKRPGKSLDLDGNYHDGMFFSKLH